MDVSPRFIAGSCLNMVFFLKVNRNEPYTFNNLRHWINIIKCFPKWTFYIICDKDELKERILERLAETVSGGVFLESDYSEEAQKIVKDMIGDSNWEKAAYAHLTTFLYARDNGIRRFWNIDADDTTLCIPPNRAAVCLMDAQDYAEANGIQLFSLDMWASRARQTLPSWSGWSFGVTYSSADVDWAGIMLKHGERFKIDFKGAGAENIDNFMTWLKGRTEREAVKEPLRIENFYFENLKFIHYSNDFVKRPSSSWLCHYKNGKILFPILYYWFDLKELGLVDIDPGVIKLDVHITDDETRNFLMEYCMEGGTLAKRLNRLKREAL